MWQAQKKNNIESGNPDTSDKAESFPCHIMLRRNYHVTKTQHYKFFFSHNNKLHKLCIVIVPYMHNYVA